MGAFGYGALENDNALDWCCVLERATSAKEVYGWIYRALDISRHDRFAGYDEARVAARYVALFGMYPLVRLAEVAVGTMLLHEEWHRQWKKPQKLRSELEHLAGLLREVRIGGGFYKPFREDADRLKKRFRRALFRRRARQAKLTSHRLRVKRLKKRSAK